MVLIAYGSLDNFIKQQLHEYNIGKRHLANMMGKDPEFFTQEDVDVNFDTLFALYNLSTQYLYIGSY